MGNLVNQLTGIAGIKLFPGGPYKDAGVGDQALAASQPLQAAGQQLLGMGTAAMPDLFSQIAGTAGINNPLGAMMGAQTTTPGTGIQNPYGLSPTQLTGYNTQAGNINAQRKSALDAFRSSSTGRGLASSTAKATEQYINNLADTQLNQTFSNFVQQAQQQRMQGLLTLLSGAQQNIAQGGGLIGGNVGTLQNAAQQAQAASQQGIADFISALTTGLVAGGVIPTTAGKKKTGGTQPTQTGTQAGTMPALQLPGIAPMSSTGQAAMADPNTIAAMAALFAGMGMMPGFGGLGGTEATGRNPQAIYNNPAQVGG